MIKFDARKLAAVAIAQDINSSTGFWDGVYLSGDKAVATDGHMLTVATDASFDNDSHHIMPISKRAITAMKSKNANLVIFESGTLSVRSDQDEVLYLEPCQEINGAFPEWKRVIPDDTGEVSHGTFTWHLLERIAQTAKILGSGSLSFKGKGSKEPHLVTYSSNADVFSVVMPFKI